MKKKIVLAWYCFSSLLVIASTPLGGIANHASEAQIAVIVNQDVVTYGDIYKRGKLILLSSGRVDDPITVELKSQVLEALIQEKLQKQLAEKADITVSSEEINESLSHLASENNMNLDQMKTFFSEKGVPVSTLAERIKVNILWMKTVRTVLGSTIQVTQADVEKEKARLEALSKKDQILMGEIVYLTNTKDSVAHTENKIKEAHKNLQQGVPFVVVARNFSQVPSSAQGGVIGWMDIHLAPEQAKNLKVGEFTQPIQMGNRWVIFQCLDRKKAGELSEKEAKVSYVMAKYTFQDPNVSQVPEALQNYMNDTALSTTCDSFAKSGEKYGLEVSKVDNKAYGELPDVLQKIVYQMKLGRVDKPLKISENELLFLMKCSETKAGKDVIPDDKTIKQSLMEKKVQDLAVIEFNKVKARAKIEYRMQR